MSLSMVQIAGSELLAVPEPVLHYKYIPKMMIPIYLAGFVLLPACSDWMRVEDASLN